MPAKTFRTGDRVRWNRSQGASVGQGGQDDHRRNPHQGAQGGGVVR